MDHLKGRGVGKNCCYGEKTEKCMHTSKLDGVIDIGVTRVVLCLLSTDFPKCKSLTTAPRGIAHCRCPGHMKVYSLSDEKMADTDHPQGKERGDLEEKMRHLSNLTARS
ncbi:MAG: hypothetical protein ACOYOS_24980 [Syntrophales bacterium]